MVTLALELTRAMLAQRGESSLTLFCSRERPAGVNLDGAEFVLSPHRHELAQKLLWLPFVEANAGFDAMLYPYWPSPPLRRRSSPPAAVFVHDLAFRVRPAEVPWQQRAYLRAVLPSALRHAAAVMTPSATTRDDVLRFYGSVPGLLERLSVVPEGPTPLPQPGRLPAGVRPGFILAVGTVEPRKNYTRLLGAYRRLRLRRQIQMVVAGRAGWAYGEALVDLRSQPGVTYLGHVDDSTLAALYKAATAFAFPSLYEGFGLPLLDALAWGVPALIGNRGALPELAAGAALEVDAEDAIGIAAGLERLLDDKSLRRRLIVAGRKRAAAFSWERSGREVLERLDP